MEWLAYIAVVEITILTPPILIEWLLVWSFKSKSEWKDILSGNFYTPILCSVLCLICLEATKYINDFIKAITMILTAVICVVYIILGWLYAIKKYRTAEETPDYAGLGVIVGLCTAILFIVWLFLFAF